MIGLQHIVPSHEGYIQRRGVPPYATGTGLWDGRTPPFLKTSRRSNELFFLRTVRGICRVSGETSHESPPSRAGCAGKGWLFLPELGDGEELRARGLASKDCERMLMM